MIECGWAGKIAFAVMVFVYRVPGRIILALEKTNSIYRVFFQELSVPGVVLSYILTVRWEDIAPDGGCKKCHKF